MPMSEKEICDWFHVVAEYGRTGRRVGTVNPFKPGTLCHTFYDYGWQHESLRLTVQYQGADQ